MSICVALSSMMTFDRGPPMLLSLFFIGSSRNRRHHHNERSLSTGRLTLRRSRLLAGLHRVVKFGEAQKGRLVDPPIGVR